MKAFDSYPVLKYKQCSEGVPKILSNFFFAFVIAIGPSLLPKFAFIF